MMALKFMGDVPFYQVHINGIVRDAARKKMSKTSGNVIEPLQLIEEYGADAVRFTLSSMAVPGTDIPFSTDRMKGYSAFANKVWNAARFLLLYLKESDQAVEPARIDQRLQSGREQLAIEDRWILHRMNQVASEVSEALDKYRFHDASSAIYQFIWHELCDWYIELVKPVLAGTVAPEERDGRVEILVHVLDYTLRILHPFMPFITEEIWQKMPHKGESIMVQDFPTARQVREDPAAALAMTDMMDLVSTLRSLRSELNIEPRKALDAFLVVPDPDCRRFLESNKSKVCLLARLNSLEFAPSLPQDRMLLKGVWRLGEYGLDIRGAIDFASERSRLQKEMERTLGEIERLLKKINSHEFAERAPAEVVAESQARHAELLEKHRKLESTLNQLPSL
jgi:valyl-tRNA synthetase